MLPQMMRMLLAPRETLTQAHAAGLKHPFIPAVILMLSAAGVVAIYYSLVDFGWLRDQFVGRMQADQRAIASSIITPGFLISTSVAAALLKTLAWLVALSSYFYWVDRLRGRDSSFKAWLVFASLSYSPTLLLFPVGVLAVIVAPGHRVLPGDLDTTSLSHMLGGFSDTRWQSVTASLSLVQLWSLSIQMVCFDTWTGRRDDRAAGWMVAAIPTVLFYAVWAMLTSVSAK